ncbi:MAG: hypothetical protein JRI88_03005 [Deltaproteobacteria bacterium]|nr:hypothetical protein [Deltaproteobacteria bacterium]
MADVTYLLVSGSWRKRCHSFGSRSIHTHLKMMHKSKVEPIPFGSVFRVGFKISIEKEVVVFQ